jgi:glucose/arabinose dehydrogenase
MVRLLIFSLLLFSWNPVVACARNQQQKPAAAQSTPSALRKYHIKASDLPPPTDYSASNGPEVVSKPSGAELTLPKDFKIGVFAEGGFNSPRWLALAPNGDIFVAESRANRITVLRDKNGDGMADDRFLFTDKVNQPFGMAFWKNYLYIANTDSVIRFTYQSGQTAAAGNPEKIADLPGQGYRQHWTRNIVFSPDGSKMYVSVGSESNVDAESEPMRAAITEFNPDGTGKRIFASGIRNPIGMAFHPQTKALYAAVQERDRIGDDLVPDFVTRVQFGEFYGWPYSYIGQNVDPRRKGEKPELVRKSLVPDVLVQAHSAVMGMIFYTGNMFPEEYRGDAYVALHGSWNRTKRTGYKLIRVPFENGRPTGGYEDFVTGWMLSEDSDEVWGRPVCPLVLKDGSMLLSDDGAHKIWRISYIKTALRRK